MKILAFPGMGKTPLSLKVGKYIDLDFGHFRDSLGVTKENEHKLLKSFANLMTRYEHDGFIVLSNEPKLVDYTSINHIYLPSNARFAAKKLKTSVDQASKWIADWEVLAKKANVPVTFIKVGLDHYLNPGSKAQKGGDRK